MASNFLDFAVQVTLLLLSASLLLTVFKVIKGPTLPDRILALDMLVAVAIGFIAVIGIKTGYTLYLDIAIALGLVGFLATVAFSRFILARGVSEEERLEINADDVSGSILDVEVSAKPNPAAKTSPKASTSPKAKTNKPSTRKSKTGAKK